MSVRARDRSRGGNAVVKGRALLQSNLTAQLISSLFLTRGTGAATLTRATVGTFTDFEGLQKTALAGEVRETGARRVANLWGIQSATLAVAAANTMTLAAGTYVFSMGAGTGTATFSGTGGATGTLTANATHRTSVSKTITAGTLIVTGSVAILVDLQVENTTGQANQNPSEYVSNGVIAAPYRGAGVDGVKYFSSQNGNTVASNVVTEDTGAAIASATTKGLLCEPMASNSILQSNNFSAWTQTLTPTPTQNSVGITGGLNEAWTISDNDPASYEQIYQTNTLTSAPWTYSIFIKKTTGAQASYPIIYSLSTVGNLIALCTVDTSNGVATKWTAFTGYSISAGVDATCINFSDLFWRVTLTFTATAVLYYIAVVPAGSVTATKSTGIFEVAAQGSVIVQDAQLELGSTATSHIATTTVAVTRNADVLAIPTTGNIGTTGSVYFEFTPTHTPVGSAYFFGSYTDANGHVQIYHDATSMRMHKSVAGVAYDATIANAFVAGTTYKVAGRFGTAGQQIAINGVLGTANTDVSAAVIAATMQVGADGAGTGQPAASIKNFSTSTTPWTDLQLKAMTL